MTCLILENVGTGSKHTRGHRDEYMGPTGRQHARLLKMPTMGSQGSLPVPIDKGGQGGGDGGEG